MTNEIDNLKNIFGKFLDQKNSLTIWEIGSRDGKDATLLCQAFPNALVHAFEPNPDTFHLVFEQAAKSNGKILAHNLALTNNDGIQTFLKIDTQKTITTWADGNPGASSFFPAHDSYKSEKYIQIPVEVECRRPSTLLCDSKFSVPNFLWIDVQGSELNLFKGFGDFLAQLDLIYVELSLKPVYENAPLAEEVVQYLSTYFNWISVVNKSTSQIDALFVSKRLSTFGQRLNHHLLRASLKSKLLWGISDNPFPINLVKSMLKKIYIFIFRQIYKLDSELIWKGAYNFLKFRINPVKKLAPFNSHVRKLLTVLPPSDPLKKFDTNLPEISVVIPVTEKDFETLRLCIEGVVENSKNPINRISLVCPQKHVDQLKTKFPQTSVLNEESLIDKSIANLLCEFPTNRIGWIKQQLIKLKYTLNSDLNVLVLDSDTVLLKSKTWIASDGTQILSISDEYHTPYAQHFSMFSKLPPTPWSFVTHHQLMQPKIVKEFLGSDGENLFAFLSLASRNEPSSLSEYHSYGAWMHHKHPNKIRYSSSLNKAVTPVDIDNLSIKLLNNIYSNYSSVSFHKYVI